MVFKANKIRNLITIITFLILTVGLFLPISQASLNIETMKGIQKGPSSLPVIPIKKSTLIQFDEEELIDDYSYLAAVPTAVFKNNDKLISHPLLYYQEEYKYDDDKERSLNARQGLDYFMEDWMDYCNGMQDQMTLVNVDQRDAKQWAAKKCTEINADNPYDIANQLALEDWSYSKNAVVAVIDEYEKFYEKTEGEISGEFSLDKDIKKIHFTVPQTNKLNPQFEPFNVPEGYKYIQARAWYPCFYLAIPGAINISIPAGDKDLQLYCKYDNDWMQVDAIDAWNAKSGMDKDYGRAYIYKSGDWRIGITDVPTKALFGRYGSWGDILTNIVKGVIYQVEIEMYPGVKIPLDVSPPYFCRNAKFNFECKNTNTNFKYLLLGPNGEKILDAEDGEIKVSKLGECVDGESYEFVIYAKEDVSGTFEYEITYSWEQNSTKEEGDSLTSATEGSVLASVLNSPLLYTSTSKISDDTKDVLYKLGVENIYLINIGNHLKNNVVEDLENIAKIKEEYTDCISIYKAINDLSGNSTDIVFSTLDPWTSWLVAELEPDEEKVGALHLGPAAYCAAHHGSPVLIVDNHPELSSAIVWHTEFWRRHCSGYICPTVSEMYLTGSRVYDFLNKNGLDKKGMESIITVAGQFDIGPSWDRMFVGKAVSGRFTFSPVDTAYWISKDMFYPALIFENPAMDPKGIELINGSMSRRGPLGRLIIERPSGPDEYNYPVLNSFMPVYIHRFNERASKYFNFVYQCANGVTPGKENTFEPIDDGINLIHNGEAGSFWPDLSETDCVPFYFNRCGYDNVFSTNFDIAMKNLDAGCIIWMVGTHGNSPNGGVFMFHDPDSPFRNKNEPNPWRGYEWYLGSTEEPDTMTSEIHGILPMLLGNPNANGIFRTALDFAPAKKPIMDFIAKIANLPIIKRFAPEWLKDTEDYYDGIVGSSFLSTLGTIDHNGVEIDDSIGNIRSCGLITAACLPAYKYLHLTMVRHGSNFQIIDPWGTSWYSSFWEATIPRDIALGDTLGEAYAKGMSHVGILYLGGGGIFGDEPQWWWDKKENVCYFGDPDMRVFTPSTKYSDKNYWERKDTLPLDFDNELNLNGHMPYGATSYPKEKQPGPEISVYLLFAILIIIILVIAIAASKSSKNNKKTKKKKPKKKK